MRELLNPAYGMFKEYPESRMLWFNETVRFFSLKHGLFFACV